MNKKTLLLICISGLLGSCGFETGNPVHHGNEDHHSSPIQETLYTLPSSSCQKLNQCFNWDIATCENELWYNSTWGLFYNLSSANLAEISYALSNGDLQLNIDALGSCSDQIKNLSCDSEVLNNAIVDGQPNNQNNIFQLFEGIDSCKEIVSP
ncbi:MAG: hypothetical protein VX642_09725 [Bdellovibrionota bacterium]|nr:hypothetical protein [Bdellovibrionota bacterium]